LRQQFLAAVTEDHVRQLAEGLLRQALDGDLGAAKLVLQYALGAPLAAPDPDRLDLDEIRLLQEVPHSGYVLRGGQVPAELTLVLLRTHQESEGEKIVAKAVRKAQTQAARLAPADPECGPAPDQAPAPAPCRDPHATTN
jgi:hypothetical protein